MAVTEHTKAASGTPLKFAVVGCGHGEFDTIYATLEGQCAVKGWALSDLDCLIICGDVQAARNDLDLTCMSVPRKYRRLGDFHKYYSGAAKAPVLTLVIGGNHEASNYFFELYHGGWLAPNIYYLGAASVIRYGPCRIAGLSGIYHAGNYHKPHKERLPYDRDLVRSIYHIREYDVQKLLQITEPVDIALSHDWPTWVELFGDHETLFAQKPHFLESAKIDKLGSKPAAEIMNHLRPSHWFSGHMHAKFYATVEHRGSSMEESVRELSLPEKLKTSLPVLKKTRASSKVASSKVKEGQELEKRDKGEQTEFLALGKVGDSIESFMELMEIELPPHRDDIQYSKKTTNGKYTLCYDEEWLAITRAYNDTLRIPDPDTLTVPPLKGQQKSPAASMPKHRNWVKENIVEKGLLGVPHNFVKLAPEYEVSLGLREDDQIEYSNSQTSTFAELLGMRNWFHLD